MRRLKEAIMSMRHLFKVTSVSFSDSTMSKVYNETIELKVILKEKV